MISSDQIQSLNGSNVVDSDGNKIGSVGQIYLDDHSDQPAWVTVKTGLFGTSESFVPLQDAQFDGNDLTVPYTKDKVKDAPRVDADAHLERDQESDLYSYYGMGDSTAGTTQDRAGYADTTQGQQGYADTTSGRSEYTDDAQAQPGYAGAQDGQDAGFDQRDERRDRAAESGIVGQDTSGPTTDEAMTRSEEQLNVGTETRETGRARLRKYVVTENVTTTVPVSHEEVRVVREPITEENRGEALSGGDLTEEEHEVTLHEEVPVVDKQTVPVERVKLDTETVTGEEEVNEQVRKEQIETEGTDVSQGGTGRRQSDDDQL